ncbi:MAG: class I SAM-dependent methyltransferase [Halobacteriovoraceae bacterium]|nr:class I SAM-dependent methyltransferase [Halobacteriovoraceae bacterium]
MNDVSSIYPGEELDHFFLQKNWGKYVLKKLKGTIQGRCVEIGPGLGYFSESIVELKEVDSLDLFEPDSKNATFLESTLGSNSKVSLTKSSYQSLGNDSIDTFIMMDVLEHIKEDRKFLEILKNDLKREGRIVLLLPAHMFLFSEFDKSIGHYRRYNKQMIERIVPSGMVLTRCLYLDSIGILASLVAKFTKGQPQKWQLWIWDKLIVPLSRITDPLLFHRVGKSMISIIEFKKR